MKTYKLIIETPYTREELTEAIKAAIEAGRDGQEDRVSEEFIAAHRVVLTMASATRRRAFLRNQARVQARKWLLAETGAAKLEDVEFSTFDASLTGAWMAIWQAADIIGSLVPDQCEGFALPESIEEWAELPDYIYDPALEMAWRLNPHWLNEQLALMSPGPTEGNV